MVKLFLWKFTNKPTKFVNRKFQCWKNRNWLLQIKYILENYKIQKVDYLNIDAEGMILKSFQLLIKKYKPSLVSIEYNNYNFAI